MNDINDLNFSKIKDKYNRLNEILNLDVFKRAASDVNSDKFNKLCESIMEYSRGDQLLDDFMYFFKEVVNYDEISKLKIVYNYGFELSKFLKDIENYKECVFNKNELNMSNLSDEIIEDHKNYKDACKEYERVFRRQSSSDPKIVLIDLTYILAVYKKQLLEDLHDYSNKLKKLYAEYTLSKKSNEYTVSDEVVNLIKLPEKICIGKLTKPDGSSILNWENADFDNLEKYCEKEKLFVNIKDKGNIIIKAPINTEKDDKVYEYISNMVLRYFDSFPLCSLRVMLIDEFESPYFTKFITGLNSESEKKVKVTRTMQINRNYKDIVPNLNNRLTDLTNYKLVDDIHDIYDLYNYDNNEYFNLVVIRNGLNSLLQYSSSSQIKILSNMIDKNSNEHRCGFRFIIVDDIDRNSKQIGKDDLRYLDVIEKNSDIIIKYDNGKFTTGKYNIVPLSHNTSYNQEQFNYRKSANIAKAIKTSVTKPITFDELGCINEEVGYIDSSILNIPIGKSGNEILSIPFSCADTGNSNAGKNIGLMVLGNSGTGKSSLYHSLIVNGAFKYSPDDLEFWLLDFKSNSSAGIYLATNENIPHIKMVAPNSKINDAYNILQLLNEELDKRNNAFNFFGNKFGRKFNNVFEYNKYIRENGIKAPNFPRIILMIDEAQEMFRDTNNTNSDDLTKEISTLITKAVDRGRSAGIHLALFAQNLSGGKSYTLQNFVSQLQCKCSFRLSSDNLSNSGFKGEFDNHKDEIEKLDTGEMYISFSSTDLVKCRVCFAEGSQLIGYLSKVIEKYPNYNSKVLKIGITEKLLPTNQVKGSTYKYLDLIEKPTISKNSISCVIGEDAYTLMPIQLTFSETKASSVYIVGSDRGITTSVFASLLYGLSNIDCNIYVCNGLPREDSYYKQLISEKTNINTYRMVQIDKCVEDIYKIYLERKKQEEQTDDFESTPVFGFLNDFETQDKIVKNVILQSSNESSNNNSLNNNTSNDFQSSFFADMFADDKLQSGDEIDKSFKEINNLFASSDNNDSNYNDNNKIKFDNISIREALAELLMHGYRYNIYLIVTLQNEEFMDFDDAVRASNNKVLFNYSEYPSVADSYIVKDLMSDMLQEKQILNFDDDFEFVEEDDNESNESFAILCKGNKKYIKFRPVIFNKED